MNKKSFLIGIAIPIVASAVIRGIRKDLEYRKTMKHLAWKLEVYENVTKVMSDETIPLSDRIENAEFWLIVAED